MTVKPQPRRQRAYFTKLWLLVSVCMLGFSAVCGAGVLSGNCRLGNQPAATLLVPFFETNLDSASGKTTLVSINNSSMKPALARMVLWTNWGVPTLAFDVYLTGFDVQTFNVRDLLTGSVPTTGPDVSPSGSLSQSGSGFAGCPAQTSGASARKTVASPLQLSPADLAWLQAAHTGQPLPGSGPQLCASSATAGPQLATGYITIDSVNRCSPPTVGTLVNTPAHALYFAKGGTGLASDANVLWGDVIYVSPHDNVARSQAAVSIVADPDFFQSGDYTFYGRYVGFDGRDDRMPLSSLYYTRFFNGGNFSGGTDLIVWRDNRQAAVAPTPCGAAPSWSPLGELQLLVFDEEENPTQILHSNAFPLAVQKVHVGDAALPAGTPFGWLMLDLWHPDGTHAQAWVGNALTASGRFSVGHDALRADDLCNFGP